MGKNIWFCNNKKKHNSAKDNFLREANSRPAFQENSGILWDENSVPFTLESATGS